MEIFANPYVDLSLFCLLQIVGLVFMISVARAAGRDDHVRHHACACRVFYGDSANCPIHEYNKQLMLEAVKGWLK